MPRFPNWMDVVLLVLADEERGIRERLLTDALATYLTCGHTWRCMGGCGLKRVISPTPTLAPRSVYRSFSHLPREKDGGEKIRRGGENGEKHAIS